jgi:hypothetical protein
MSSKYRLDDCGRIPPFEVTSGEDASPPGPLLGLLKIPTAEGAANHSMSQEELRRLQAERQKRFRSVPMRMYEDYIVEVTGLVKAWLNGSINHDELRRRKIAANSKVHNSTLAEYHSTSLATVQHACALRERFRQAAEQLAVCYMAAGTLLYEAVGGDDIRTVRKRAFDHEVRLAMKAQSRSHSLD